MNSKRRVLPALVLMGTLVLSACAAAPSPTSTAGAPATASPEAPSATGTPAAPATATPGAPATAPATTGATPAGTAPSGTLTVAQQAILPRPDPYALTTNMEHSIVLSMYDPLSRVDEEGQLTYYLAESYEPESETSWIVNLKPGVMWSDGTEFTADDVVFTIDRMRDPATGTIWTAVYSYIESAEAVDSHTVRINTTRQVVNLPQDYGRMSMMPKAAFETMGADAFFQNPVTSGPFKFVELVPGERFTLEANMDYHLGPPRVQTLIFKQVPDPATRVAEAVTQASDIVFDIPPTEIPTINDSGVAEVLSYPGVGRIVLEFAIATTPELEDPRVREAAFLAIDAEAINDAIYDGAGGLQTGWLDRHTFGQNTTLVSHGYDPDRAQTLLADAGYPDGLAMPFTIRSPDGLLTEDVGLVVNDMLNAAGFITEFETLEAAEFVERTNDAAHVGLYMRGSRNSTGDPDQILRAYDPKREDKFLLDETLEAMIDAQASEPDPVARAALVAEVDAYIHNNFLGYNILTWPGIEAVNNRVEGFIPSPFEVRWFHQVSVTE
jgi:peptide/nickel transport system substrate-binding protein